MQESKAETLFTIIETQRVLKNKVEQNRIEVYSTMLHLDVKLLKY